MKPLIIILAILATWPQPVLAQESMELQYQQAVRVFLPYGLDGKLADGAHAAFSENLAGRWFEGAQAIGLPDSDIFKRACAKLGVEIAVSKTGFTTRRAYRKKDRSEGFVETKYLDLGGGSYRVDGDLESVLERLGLDDTLDSEPRLQSRRRFLSIAPKLVRFFRTSPDVFVMLDSSGVATAPFDTTSLSCPK